MARRLICGRYASNMAYRFLSWSGHSSLSNQYLSALELGNAKRTERNERLLCCAMEEVISSRERSLDGLRETLLQYQGRLLEAVEADSDEL